MTSPARRRLRARHGESTDQWLQALTAESAVGDDAHETQRRRNWLDAVRAYDPGAVLEEELRIRLTGETADGGGLDFMVGDALLRPLQDVVDAAAPDGTEAPRLQAFAISSGSTIVHVRPATPQRSAPAGATPVDASRSDPALHNMLSALDAVERREDLRRWASMVGSVQRLAAVLDRLELVMGLEWRAVDGRSTTARLTAQGRQYLSSLSAGRTTRSPRAITGRVSELRESGLVKVKQGTSRTSPVDEVKVEADDLLGLHLELGEQVTLRVLEEIQWDALGNKRATALTLVDVLARAGRLDRPSGGR